MAPKRVLQSVPGDASEDIKVQSNRAGGTMYANRGPTVWMAVGRRHAHSWHRSLAQSDPRAQPHIHITRCPDLFVPDRPAAQLPAIAQPIDRAGEPPELAIQQQLHIIGATSDGIGA